LYINYGQHIWAFRPKVVASSRGSSLDSNDASTISNFPLFNKPSQLISRFQSSPLTFSSQHQPISLTESSQWWRLQAVEEKSLDFIDLQHSLTGSCSCNSNHLLHRYQLKYLDYYTYIGCAHTLRYLFDNLLRLISVRSFVQNEVVELV